MTQMLVSLVLAILGLSLVYTCLYMWLYTRGWKQLVFTGWLYCRVFWIHESRPKAVVRGIATAVWIELRRRLK